MEPTTSVATPSHIVLVHGLGRTKTDMLLLARWMRQAFPGSTVHRFGYNSRGQPLQESARQLGAFVERTIGHEDVSFIGHSLGGIVVRALDAWGMCSAPMKRLVTLGSPHNGAMIAALLARYSFPRRIFGPVLEELATLSLPSTTRQLEIGCIIGATGTRLGFFPLLGSDNDGLVLAKEALLDGCSAHVSMLAFHGLMPFSPRVARAATSFLQRGRF